MARKDQKIVLTPLEEKLFNLPNIGDILKAGKEVRVDQLPLDLQREIGLNSGQSFSFDPTFLKNFNTQVNEEPVLTNKKGERIDRVTGQPIIDQNLASKVSPFDSIASALKSTGNPAVPNAAPQPKTLAQTPVEQSQLVSGGIPQLIQQLKNFVIPKVSNIPGVNIPFDIAQAAPAKIGTGGAIGAGENGLMEFLKRTKSDLTKGINNLVPSQTVEQAAIKELSAKNPELASTTDSKGLNKFKGTGEFRINGQRFKIDNNANIVKIG